MYKVIIAYKDNESFASPATDSMYDVLEYVKIGMKQEDFIGAQVIVLKPKE